MRKQIKFAIVLLSIILFYTYPVFADQPPDPGGNPTGDPVGGGSPLGGGLFLMLMAGAVYGFQKFRMAIQK